MSIARVRAETDMFVYPAGVCVEPKQAASIARMVTEWRYVGRSVEGVCGGRVGRLTW